MTDIEAKALALVNEIAAARGTSYPCVDRANDSRWEALCRAIEQHEAFRQEVSDALLEYYGGYHNASGETLERFIIKSDPLVEVINDADDMVRKPDAPSYAEAIRAALAARGLTITTVEKD